MKTINYIIKLVLFLLVFNSSTYAQTEFVQSRFGKSEVSFETNCSIGNTNDCMPEVDGVVHMRFTGARIDDMGTNSVDDDRFIFTVQVRKTGSPVPYSVAGFGINYNTQAFGPSLATPAFTRTPVHLPLADPSQAQCSFTRGSIMTGTPSYRVSGVRDTTPSLLYVEQQASGFTDPASTVTAFNNLTGEWEDIFTLSCQIRFDADKDGSIETDEGTVNAEAGLTFSNRFWFDHQFWNPFEGLMIGSHRRAFNLADNDLRGFRLDGKTWAKDYARYDDSTGVRVEFSKGIKTQLLPSHFVLEDADPESASISRVEHTPNSIYASVTFNGTVNSGVLRIATDTTVIINDVEDNALANGNFIAALEYDKDAPRAISIQKVNINDNPNKSTSTWVISFDQAINSATVSAENLCITNEEGICPQSGERVAPYIVSATATATVKTQINVIIEEGVRSSRSTHSIEFRRNAVLGEDNKIVEDYQTKLRDVIELEDKIAPTIRVNGLTAQLEDDEDNDPNTVRYRVVFLVHSSEVVNGLFDPSSYKLLRVTSAPGEPLVAHLLADARLVVVRATGVVGPEGPIVGRTAYVFASVELSMAEASTTTGFALALSEGALQDSSGNSPQVGLQGILDPMNAQAISRLDRMPPTIEVVAKRTANIEARDDTNIRFAMNFIVSTSENVVGFGDASTYELFRVLDDNSTATIAVIPTSVESVATNTVVVRYTGVRLSVADAEQTKGFLLGRGVGNVLRDTEGNQPINVHGDQIAPRSPIDPQAITRVILRLKLRLKVLIEGALE